MQRGFPGAIKRQSVFYLQIPSTFKVLVNLLVNSLKNLFRQGKLRFNGVAAMRAFGYLCHNAIQTIYPLLVNIKQGRFLEVSCASAVDG